MSLSEKSLGGRAATDSAAPHGILARPLAQRLLELGAACTDGAGAMSYAACCCDEAATYLDDEPPRVADALEVVRLGLAQLGPAAPRELPADVAALLGAELILRGEVEQ